MNTKAPQRKYAENNIRRIRLSNKLTMKELAERLPGRTNLTTIDKLENGRMALSLDWIIKIAAGLGVSPKELFDDPKSKSAPNRQDGKTIFVLNGPNLNLLGTREPTIYGSDTLDDIAGRLEDQARPLGLTIDMRQSNHEGHLIDWLHEANAVGAKAVLLNAGGYTHTSIAIHDAIKSITVPVIEVHLSDPHKREEFRHLSYVGMAAHSCFAGHGAASYTLALDAAAKL